MTVTSRKLSKGGLNLNISLEGEQSAQTMLKTLGSKAERPLVRALNRAIQGMRTDLVDGARENYNVKAKDVRNSISTIKAHGSSGKKAKRLDAKIKVSGSSLPLYSFGPRPRNPTPRSPPRIGVSVQVAKATPRSKIPGTFVAELPTRGIGIYRRTGKTGKKDKLAKRYSLSVPQMVDHENVLERVQSGAQERFEKNLEHEIDRHLQKMGLGK